MSRTCVLGVKKMNFPNLKFLHNECMREIELFTKNWVRQPESNEWNILLAPESMTKLFLIYGFYYPWPLFLLQQSVALKL